MAHIGDQLLESGIKGGDWPLESEDYSNLSAGVQKTVASILKQNAELRRRNNNLLRYSLSAAKTGYGNSVCSFALCMICSKK